MPAHYLGRAPGVFETLSAKRQKEVVEQIFGYLRTGNVLETACWASEVDPEELAAAMEKDAHLKRGVMRELHLAEVEMVRKVNEGGPGLSVAKAALEALKLTRKAWTPKSQVDLTKEFAEALEEMKETLPPEHYDTVVRIFLKHQS